jgi:hypothetical protein
MPSTVRQVVRSQTLAVPSKQRFQWRWPLLRRVLVVPFAVAESIAFGYRTPYGWSRIFH